MWEVLASFDDERPPLSRHFMKLARQQAFELLEALKEPESGCRSVALYFHAGRGESSVIGVWTRTPNGEWECFQ